VYGAIVGKLAQVTAHGSKAALAARRRSLERRADEVIAVREAAALLGVSLSTMKRRILPVFERRSTPWGTRGIAREELLGLMGEPWPGRGRPGELADDVRERIRIERRRGNSLRAIADGLTADGVATVHGGRRWWPSTVRQVLG
jgi:hypothetical protein